MNNNCFDFLRFAFAVNIMLAHLVELSINRKFYFLLEFTDSIIGIQGFFVISGFLVAKSYINTPSLKAYFIKRAKRILPAYVFVIFLSAIALSLTSSFTLSDYFQSADIPKYLGSNLIFLNFLHPCLPGVFENNLMCVVNGSLWTLKVEEGFYVILPIIFYVIKKTKTPFIILSLLYLCSILYWYLMINYFESQVLAKQLPGFLSYFVGGIFLFLNQSFLQQNKTKLLVGSIVALIISKFAGFQMDFIYPIAFSTLIITLAYSIKWLNNFGKYGDFTYGVYIFHFPVIQLFKQYDLFVKYNTLLMGLCVILVTLLLAVFSWFFIEKRFLDRYKTTSEVKLTQQSL